MTTMRRATPEGGRATTPLLPPLLPSLCETPTEYLTRLAREALERQPAFAGRSRDIQIQVRGGRVVLSGRVPSFYLKQLAQAAVSHTPAPRGVENHLDVVRWDGLSSVRESIYRYDPPSRCAADLPSDGWPWPGVES